MKLKLPHFDPYLFQRTVLNLPTCLFHLECLEDGLSEVLTLHIPLPLSLKVCLISVFFCCIVKQHILCLQEVLTILAELWIVSLTKLSKNCLGDEVEDMVYAADVVAGVVENVVEQLEKLRHFRDNGIVDACIVGGQIHEVLASKYVLHHHRKYRNSSYLDCLVL